MTRCLMNTLTIGLLAMVAGCDTPQEPWGSVEGKVLLKNAPVANVTVLFSNEQQGISLYGQSDEQGRFQIRSAKVPGIPVGEYRVAIVPAITAADMATDTVIHKQRPPEVKSPVPPRYRDLKTTDLVANVQTGKNEFEFVLLPE